MDQMNNLMIDLETLGTRPDSVILSIGAVFFGPDGTDMQTAHAGKKRLKRGEERFREAPRTHIFIDAQSAELNDCSIQASTVLWWMKQSEEARKAMYTGQINALDPRAALQQFSNFIDMHSDQKRVKVWGNGANFDNVLLRELYARLGMPAPWQFFNDRCFRTLKNLYPQVPGQKPRVAHDALEDAIAQANHAAAIHAFAEIDL